MKSKNTVLILGATGGIGGEIARKLIREKWDVRALRRNTPQNEEHGDITWINGDALNAEQVAAAASGCSVIVHAVNPPGYRNWEQLVLPMLQNTINAAERNDALIVLPGTVYNYGRMLSHSCGKIPLKILLPEKGQYGCKWRRHCSTGRSVAVRC
jgi:nucleoside-diphosphate-sugar epimerase